MEILRRARCGMAAARVAAPPSEAPGSGWLEIGDVLPEWALLVLLAVQEAGTEGIPPEQVNQRAAPLGGYKVCVAALEGLEQLRLVRRLAGTGRYVVNAAGLSSWRQDLHRVLEVAQQWERRLWRLRAPEAQSQLKPVLRQLQLLLSSARVHRLPARRRSRRRAAPPASSPSRPSSQQPQDAPQFRSEP